jgi:hypothetical protein
MGGELNALPALLQRRDDLVEPFEQSRARAELRQLGAANGEDLVAGLGRQEVEPTVAEVEGRMAGMLATKLRHDLALEVLAGAEAHSFRQ